MKRLVLAGAGHAHALVLRQWVSSPRKGVEILIVSPEPLAPYSGMVPGWLAGRYRYEEIVVDFATLARAAGAAFVQGELHALDPDARTLTLADGAAVQYDLLSLNVGSTLQTPAARHARILALRPLARLRHQYETLLREWTVHRGKRPLRVSTVGGGAAGFEAMLGVLRRLRGLRPDHPIDGELVTRGARLLPDLAPAAQRAAQQALARAGVTVTVDSGWSDALDARSDLVLWATGAQAHAWQQDPRRRGALAVDDSGFVRIDPLLRSVSHPEVFAVGDCASWPTRALPKAGVHAVRMGPVLERNLRAALEGRADRFVTHRPQAQFLALLSTGDGHAIASRGRFGFEGLWAGRWKAHIDRRFLEQFRDLNPGSPEPESQASAARPSCAPTRDPR